MWWGVPTCFGSRHRNYFLPPTAMRSSRALPHICYAMRSSLVFAQRHDATLSDLLLALMMMVIMMMMMMVMVMVMMMMMMVVVVLLMLLILLILLMMILESQAR